MVERSSEDELAIHWLRDEVKRIAGLPLAWPVRRQLLKALRVTDA
jgi:hypothetical protein